MICCASSWHLLVDSVMLWPVNFLPFGHWWSVLTAQFGLLDSLLA